MRGGCSKTARAGPKMMRTGHRRWRNCRRLDFKGVHELCASTRVGSVEAASAEGVARTLTDMCCQQTLPCVAAAPASFRIGRAARIRSASPRRRRGRRRGRGQINGACPRAPAERTLPARDCADSCCFPVAEQLEVYGKHCRTLPGG